MVRYCSTIIIILFVYWTNAVFQLCVIQPKAKTDNAFERYFEIGTKGKEKSQN